MAEDRWGDTKSSTYICKTCQFYINFRCRRNAPTHKGYPAVFPTDFCGEHKVSKETMKELSDGYTERCKRKS